jgi:hypothetical protein
MRILVHPHEPHASSIWNSHLCGWAHVRSDRTYIPMGGTFVCTDRLCPCRRRFASVQQIFHTGDVPFLILLANAKVPWSNGRSRSQRPSQHDNPAKEHACHLHKLFKEMSLDELVALWDFVLNLIDLPTMLYYFVECFCTYSWVYFFISLNMLSNVVWNHCSDCLCGLVLSILVCCGGWSLCWMCLRLSYSCMCVCWSLLVH